MLDEADKLMDLGFLEQTDEIFAACSGPNVRKYMFSATFTGQVEDLAKTVMKDPIEVVIGSRYVLNNWGSVYVPADHSFIMENIEMLQLRQLSKSLSLLEMKQAKWWHYDNISKRASSLLC